MQFKTIGKNICSIYFRLAFSFADTFYYLNQIFSLTRNIPVCSSVTFNTARLSKHFGVKTNSLTSGPILSVRCRIYCSIVQLQWMTHLFQLFLPPVDKLKKNKT